MKLSSKNREGGSVLVTTLIICVVIGTLLASYLELMSTRYKMTVRSKCWNTSVPVLEAGIEEALTHLHDDASPSDNGWTAGTIGGQPVNTKQRSFPDGSYFYVTIYNASSSSPLIYSQGFVRSPLSTNQYISRMVRISTTNTPTIFTKAISATGVIDLQGSGIVDGYDSRTGGYSTSTNRHATGNIATDSTANPAINGRTGQVYGTAVVGPGGTIAVSGSGAVGDTAWNTNGNTGIQAGATNNNMNVAFPSNSPPSGGPYFAPLVTSIGGSNITFVPTGTYEISGAFTTGDSASPMIVTGNATLWVTGDFTVQDSGYVNINPGANLTLIVGGATTTISGGGVVNGTSLAANFTYIGLSSNTRMDYTGSSAFYGTINAPSAVATISEAAGVNGAMIVKSLTLSGNFHYDEALGAGGGLVVSSWTEM